MAIILVLIGGYSIGGYFRLNYHRLLVVFNGYYTSAYWWLLVAIGGYCWLFYGYFILGYYIIF
jgi:hypothetical protein